MTKSTDERSSMLVVEVRRLRIRSASDWEMRSLATSLARSLSVGVVKLEGVLCLWEGQSHASEL